MAAELRQEAVEFSALVGRAAEESFVSLKELVEKSKSGEQSDTEKKIGLLKYLVKTQQRMLRLNVLAKWCKQVGRASSGGLRRVDFFAAEPSGLISG